ncbi:MAG: hypothetical protein ACI9EF_001050 [Pseudohongiellaceae bacterium]|jgi:hypothetical protein
MARVLKPGGLMIVTTPNLLNIGARVNSMLVGHAHRHRSPVVSTAQYWSERPEDGSDNVYFGHVFLNNAFQLRFYLEHVGLQIKGVDTTRYSINSVLLAPLLYLPIWRTTRKLLTGRKAKLSKAQRQTYLDQVLSPHTLFGKKLIMVAVKPARNATSASS